MKTRVKVWQVIVSCASLVVGLGLLLVIRALAAPDPKFGEGVTLAPPVAPSASAANHLGEAVRFTTISNQDPQANDWVQWDGLRTWLAKTYPRFHGKAKREVVGAGTLFFTWPGTDASLNPMVLMAHQDVVPVDNSGAWKVPPFSGEIKEGAVWGRGSLDDKGSLIAIMEALETLAADGFQPRRTIMVACGHDEEVAGTGAAVVAQILAERHITAEFVLDEGSFVIQDYPLTKKPVALVGISEKGYATLQVTARSEGGHSSSPPRLTAVGILAQAITAITADSERYSLNEPTRQMLAALAPQVGFGLRMVLTNDWLFAPLIMKEFAKSNAGAAMLHTTIAPTMVSGSPKENVLPTKAIAALNYRLAPDDSADAALKRAQKAVQNLPVDLAWAQKPKEATATSSTKSAAFQTIAALCTAIFQVPTVPGLLIASTDSAKLRSVAKDVYLFDPVQLSLADLEMFHGTNEHLSLESLAKAEQFYARLVLTLAR